MTPYQKALHKIVIERMPAFGSPGRVGQMNQRVSVRGILSGPHVHPDTARFVADHLDELGGWDATRQRARHVANGGKWRDSIV